MYLSELQKKEIIDINSGKRIGIIIDVVVSQEGTVKSLIVEERKLKRFTANEERTVNWQQIVKIGDDIILLDRYISNHCRNIILFYYHSPK